MVFANGCRKSIRVFPVNNWINDMANTVSGLFIFNWINYMTNEVSGLCLFNYMTYHQYKI